jgi:undecaprenyl-diphosphatase
MSVLAAVQQRELRLALLLLRWRAPRLVRVLLLSLTRMGDGWGWIALAAVLVLGARAYREVLAGTLAAAAASAAFCFLKRRIKRRRPCELLGVLPEDVLPADRFSFPSGHAATSFAIATLLALAFPRAGGGVPGDGRGDRGLARGARPPLRERRGGGRGARRRCRGALLRHLARLIPRRNRNARQSQRHPRHQLLAQPVLAHEAGRAALAHHLVEIRRIARREQQHRHLLQRRMRRARRQHLVAGHVRDAHAEQQQVRLLLRDELEPSVAAAAERDLKAARFEKCRGGSDRARVVVEQQDAAPLHRWLTSRSASSPGDGWSSSAARRELARLGWTRRAARFGGGRRARRGVALTPPPDGAVGGGASSE